MLLRFLIISLAFGFVSCDDVFGAVSLNSGCFDKVISKFDTVLVKFDEAYPYGEKADEFKELAKQMRSQSNFLIAHVRVTDHGEKENQDLADRFNVKKEDFPRYLLFKQGQEEPIIHKDGWKVSEITRFVKDHTGMAITLPDCLESFDQLMGEFLPASADDKAGVIKKAEAEAEKLTVKDEKKSAAIYVKIMRQIAEKGKDYVSSEIKRVEKLKKGKVSGAKKQQFEQRLNILSSVSATLKDEL